MKFTLTNDDGIQAPGIKALAEILEGEVMVVAPDRQYSGCGHQVIIDQPIMVEPQSPNSYAVSGPPADCARLGLRVFAPDTDWLISGINAGGNMGVDQYLSGTVAAAREATLLKVKAIALSQYIQRPHPIDWQRTQTMAKRVLQALWAKPLPPGHFWNVNFPAWLEGDREPDLIYCESGREPLEVKFERQGNGYQYIGSYPDRPRQPHTDVAVCFGGDIAIALIKI